VFDLLPEMVLILDQQGRVVDQNKSAAMVLGEDRLRTQSIEQFVADGKQRQFVELLKSRVNGMNFDTQLTTADASVIDVSIHIKELRSTEDSYNVLIIKDITEQKKRDLDYLRFANVIEHTINPIQITDAKGLMVYVNPAFERSTGYRKEELIGRNPNILNSGKHSKEFWAEVWREILAGKVWLGRVENRRKDGSPLYTELLISPIVDGEGKVVGFLGAHKDITEQKMLEQQLMQSQKMESIGTLAAGIAHEVGNPLTSISSLVQVIQRTTNDEFAKEKLELIKNQINRISRTIRDLVDFSRPSAYIEQPTDVNRVIQDALNIVKYGKKVKEIDFQVSLSPHLPKLTVVPDQLTQVFINILMNAVDSLEDKPGTIWITSGTEDAKLMVTVQDTGKGIAPGDLEKIFDPFFTTKEVGKGTGLGLWVSYGIVKNFGGDILVKSQQSKGSTFTVVFPLKGRSNG
jgi:PAS domain S-box-containing protein